MPDLAFSPGDNPSAAQWNSYVSHTGGAWNTWTPVVTQGVGVASITTEAFYFRAGRFISFTAYFGFSGSGTAGQVITMTIPVACGSSQFIPVGMGVLFDSSANTPYGFIARVNTSTTVLLSPTAGVGGFNLGLSGSGFAASLVSPDNIVVSGSYMAAAG